MRQREGVRPVYQVAALKEPERTVTLSAIARRVADRNGCSYKLVTNILIDFLEVIVLELCRGRIVRLATFGAFTLKQASTFGHKMVRQCLPNFVPSRQFRAQVRNSASFEDYLAVKRTAHVYSQNSTHAQDPSDPRYAEFYDTTDALRTELRYQITHGITHPK